MYNYTILTLTAFILVGCVCLSNIQTKTTILNYEEFGPQAAAYETIGMQWWQWDTHGDSRPGIRYDIKVVVYKDIQLSRVKKAFPVIRKKHQDFRYLSYKKAVQYLDDQIQEDILPETTRVLRKTRKRIIDSFGR